VKSLQIIGGSMDGRRIPANREDGKPLGYVYRSSTDEVWLRHGDTLLLVPGGSFENGQVVFPSPEIADEYAPDWMQASDRWILWRNAGEAPVERGTW
jgi:hypothetical protein